MRSEKRQHTIRRDRSDPLYLVIGQHLKSVRRDRSLTQEQVAGELGVNASAITLYEQAKNRVPLAFFVRWCAVLEVDPSLLLAQAQQQQADKQPVIPQQSKTKDPSVDGV